MTSRTFINLDAPPESVPPGLARPEWACTPTPNHLATLGPDSLDAIYSAHLLEHPRTPARSGQYQQLLRLLKPTGWLILRARGPLPLLMAELQTAGFAVVAGGKDPRPGHSAAVAAWLLASKTTLDDAPLRASLASMVGSASIPQTGLLTLAAMTGHDLVDVATIDHHLFPQPWSYAGFLTQIVTGAAGWVIREDGQVVAYAVVERQPDQARLLKLMVIPERRQQGLAAALVAASMVRSRQWQVRAITLEVAASNLAATALYQKYGFQPTRRIVDYYRDEHAVEDGVVMTAVL